MPKDNISKLKRDLKLWYIKELEAIRLKEKSLDDNVNLSDATYTNQSSISTILFDESAKKDDTCNVSNSINSRKLNYDGSNKNIQKLYDWVIMLNDVGDLIVKGKSERGEICKSKPIVKRLTFKMVQSVYGRVYQLDGNLVDRRQELPQYIRDKFMNGFPDDWQNIEQQWYQYKGVRDKSTFQWHSSTNNDDFTSEKVSCIENHTEPDSSACSTLYVTHKTDEKVNTVQENTFSNKLPIIVPNNAAHKEPSDNLSNMNKSEKNHQSKIGHKLIEYLGEEKVLEIIQNLVNGNRSEEYICVVQELLKCIDYLVSYNSSQDTKNSDHWLVLIKKKSNSGELQPNKPVQKSEKDDDDVFGVPTIPSNILTKLPKNRKYPKRLSKSNNSKSKSSSIDSSIYNNYNTCNISNSSAKFKPRSDLDQKVKNKISNDSGCIGLVDSDCSSMSNKQKFNDTKMENQYRRKYNSDKEDLKEQELIVPRKMYKKENVQKQKPAILKIENVNVDLKSLQSNESSINDANYPEYLNENNETSFKKKDVKKKRKNENSTIISKSNAHDSDIVPKILRAWSLNLLRDNESSKSKCNLVLRGTLYNETGKKLMNNYQTNPIVKRISSNLVKTSDNEYFKLEEQSEQMDVPLILKLDCSGQCPIDIQQFCNRWKLIIDSEQNSISGSKTNASINRSRTPSRTKYSRKYSKRPSPLAWITNLNPLFSSSSRNESAIFDDEVESSKRIHLSANMKPTKNDTSKRVNVKKMDSSATFVAPTQEMRITKSAKIANTYNREASCVDRLIFTDYSSEQQP